MGEGRPLPLTSTPQRRAATLARALQQAQTSQRDRRPATDQPRSQRPWVGHLAINGRPCVPTVPGAYQRFYEGVLLALREDAPPLVDPDDVVAGLEVLDAARESAREQRVVGLR